MSFQNDNEAVLLRHLIKEIHRSEDLREAGEIVCDLVLRLYQAANVAIVYGHDVIAAGGGQRRAALDSPLTGLTDPLILRCLSTGIVATKNESEESELFPHDWQAIVCPLRNGAIYVGEGNETVAQRLPILADSISHFLESVDHRLKTQAEYRRSESQAQRTLLAFETARTLVDTLPRMARSLKKEEFLEHFAAHLYQLLPYENGVYLSATGQFFPLKTATPSPLDLESLRALARPAGSQPTLHTDLQYSPYSGLEELGNELLTAPVNGINASLGTLFLGSGPAETFAEHHRFLMSFAANILGLGLSMSELHQQSVENQAGLAYASRMSSVGQLAAGLAHEINNPLGSIVLAIDSARSFMTRRPDLVPPLLEQAEVAAERARSVVHSLLYFSRDACKGKKSERLASIVTECLAVVRPRLVQDEVEVLLTTAIPEMALYCNPGELTQVLCHLIWNAKDAVLSGPFSRRIELRLTLTENDLVIAVQDQGPGVPDEIVEKIFDPFFTTKEVGRGTGLGLSVSKEIARAHDGTLRCLRSKDGGAHFELRIPTASQEALHP